MGIVLEKYKYLFMEHRPNTLMERAEYDERLELLKVCSKYCQIMQKEPLDENYIQLLTANIYKQVRHINKIQHYIDTRYSR